MCPGYDEELAARFVAKVDGGDWSLDRCWEWMGTQTPKGYGVMQFRKATLRAHRVALELYSGEPCGEMVLHGCDNRLCVNPKHLRNGTHGDNMRDMAERRRAAREERHHKVILRRGEVVAIHALSGTGEYTTYELADMLGVSQPTVSAILTGRLWTDVKEDFADAMLKERGR